MLANAFIFQEQLSSLHAKVRPIRSIMADRDFIGTAAAHWQMIITEINYVPIFKVARQILLSLPATGDTDSSVRHLAQRALEIVSKKAALRHDLMGRIYHLLLLEAKYLGTYYTSVPAATLLLKRASTLIAGQALIGPSLMRCDSFKSETWLAAPALY